MAEHARSPGVGAPIRHLTLSVCISLQSIDPSILGCWDRMLDLARGYCGLKLNIYQNLLKINAGFDQVIGGLAALRKYRTFHRRELARFSALSKENRASTNSYLASVIETSETQEAGGRFRKRKAQERVDEQRD